MEYMDRIKSIIQTELDWSEEMWLNEINDYSTLYDEKYSINALD
jgi:hypothetical protein